MRWFDRHGEQLESVFAERRVCVTGGAGFIGSHLADALLRVGAHVSIIDDLSTSDGAHIARFIEEHPDRVRFIHGSILDESALLEALTATDAVFHLAAIASIEASLADPERCFVVNTMGTLRVAEAARLAGAKRLIYAASSSAYGDTSPPLTESAPTSPLSPYAASKLAGEQIVTAWARSRGLPGVRLRFFNVFGPRQQADSDYAAVVPIFARAILAGEALPIHGDGRQSRDFLHVTDAVLAMLLAGASEEEPRGEVYNIGAGSPTTILELADLMSRLAGKSEAPLTHEPPRAGDVPHSWADISLARKSLGFSPQTPLEQGLSELLGVDTDAHSQPSASSNR